MWVEGTLDGKYIRKSLKMQSWERAVKQLALWEATGLAEEKKAPLLLAEAVAAYLNDMHDRGLSPITMNHHVRWTRMFCMWCTAENYLRLTEIDTECLRRYFASKPHLAISTKHTSRIQLSAFFAWCVKRDWLAKNPIKGLSPLKKRPPETSAYEQSEIETLLAHIGRNDLRAFVLLLRWSGLRITDAVSLKRNRVDADGNLTLSTRKTGQTVRLPLHPDCVAALRALPVQGEYFLMDEGDTLKTAAERYREAMRVAWRKTGLKTRCYPHKFRHTFAINLLLKGVAIELVSKLLGHADIRITLGHYTPWIKARQDQLDESIKKAW
jgi:integrase/recombinase XerD